MSGFEFFSCRPMNYTKMTESGTDLLKFAEMKLTTVDRCSSNCINDFQIAAVRRTAPIIIVWLFTWPAT